MTTPAPAPDPQPAPPFTVLSGVRLVAGDYLVVTTPATGTPEQAAAFKSSLEDLLPGVTVVVVTGVSGLAAYTRAQPGEMPQIAGQPAAQPEPPPGPVSDQ